MERKCVSVNIRPTVEDKVICELSDSDHMQHPDDLKPRPGWTYRGIQVWNVNVMTMMTRKDLQCFHSHIGHLSSRGMDLIDSFLSLTGLGYPRPHNLHFSRQ